MVVEVVAAVSVSAEVSTGVSVSVAVSVGSGVSVAVSVLVSVSVAVGVSVSVSAFVRSVTFSLSSVVVGFGVAIDDALLGRSTVRFRDSFGPIV